MAAPELAGDVILQQWVEGAGAPFGRRLHDDGRVEEHSDATAEFVDGEWRFGTREAAWRDLAAIGADDVAALRRLVADGGVLDLPPLIEATGTTIGRPDQSWSVRTRARVHEVRLGGVPLERVPALEELDRAWQIAVAAAVAPAE